MATGKNHTGIFKKILVDFIGQEDPILAMLEWTAQQMRAQPRAENIFFRNQGPAYGYKIGDCVSFHPKAAERWIHPLFYHRKKTIRAGLDRVDPGSLYQRRIHT